MFIQFNHNNDLVLHPNSKKDYDILRSFKEGAAIRIKNHDDLEIAVAYPLPNKPWTEAMTRAYEGHPENPERWSIEEAKSPVTT